MKAITCMFIIFWWLFDYIRLYSTEAPIFGLLQTFSLKSIYAELLSIDFHMLSHLRDLLLIPSRKYALHRPIEYGNLNRMPNQNQRATLFTAICYYIGFAARNLQLAVWHFNNNTRDYILMLYLLCAVDSLELYRQLKRCIYFIRPQTDLQLTNNFSSIVWKILYNLAIK